MKTSRRGFFATLAAAIAARFLPKLPPIQIRRIPDPLPYWPQPAFDFSDHFAASMRATEQIRREWLKDMEFYDSISLTSAETSPVSDSPRRQS